MPEETGTPLIARSSVEVRRTYQLRVLEGPDVGVALVVDGAKTSRVLVGQSPVCDLLLTDRRVSRRHLAFELADGGLRVSDLGSTNGTYVNGLRVFEALLKGDEVVRIGDSAVRVEPHGAAAAETELPAADRFGRLVGSSLEMRRIYPVLEQLARSDVPVILEGETGTGKEILAESLHEAGPRASGPFVVFDCAAVPRELVESELFGHERGAFTGAVASRTGVFEQANGGTLLIDEIGDLDITLQPKLLRVLERRMVRRVGGDKWIPLDVRVLAATRRDLDREIQEGRFRDDLFFRLAVARIELPPLRKRKGDIAVLARHLWKAFGGVGDPSYELLLRFERYAWPGNVRELANAVSRAIALGENAVPYDPAHEGASAGDATEEILRRDLPFPRARDLALADFERRFVARALAQHKGNVTRAAAASGIGRRYLTMLVGRHGR